MNTTTLGTVIGQDAPKDAIHIAVAPVMSIYNLKVGEHIQLKPGSYTEVMPAKTNNGIGIVDPFLKETHVSAGTWFYMLLYPQTITALNHTWEHPSFMDQVGSDTDAVAFAKLEIQKIADQYDVTYDELMDNAHRWVKTGDYWCYDMDGGKFESEYLTDNFWPLYETVTGESVHKDKKHSFFTCSC